jgi:nucleolar GTP-binding protein
MSTPSFMSFHDVKPVEKADKYLDIAFSRAYALGAIKNNENVFSQRRKELKKLDLIKGTLISKLNGLLRDFPRQDDFSGFYLELFKVTINEGKYDNSLKDLLWATEKIVEISHSHAGVLTRCTDAAGLKKAMKDYIGRVSSIIKKISPSLLYLDHARREFKEYPMMKTDLFTVCIAGFPNVGKSTLLGKITTSKPEIKNYAFTTKRLNLGYAEMGGRKVQFIDAPGTLARVDKMNNIEKQAYLALKYQANIIVFIYDLTHTYPLEDQRRLFENVKGYEKPIIIYLSKTDIIDEDIVNDFKTGHEMIKDVDELRKEIVKKF